MKDYGTDSKSKDDKENVKNSAGQAPNPQLTNNFLSNRLFCWIRPMLQKGYKEKNLQLDDLYATMDKHKAEGLGDRLEDRLNRQIDKRRKKGKDMSNGGSVLLVSLVTTFGVTMGKACLLFIIFSACITLGNQILSGMYVNYFASYGTIYSDKQAIVLAFGTAGIQFFNSIAKTSYMHHMMQTSMSMRLSLVSNIYRKTLRLQTSALKNNKAGNIMSFISIDTTRLEKMTNFNFAWAGIVQLFLGNIVLLGIFGIYAVPGVAILFLLAPTQIMLGRVFATLRKKVALGSDARLKIVQDVIMGIKMIKIYAWEQFFWDNIEKARKQETKYVVRAVLIKLSNWVIIEFAGKSLLVILLAQLVATGQVFDVGEIYIAFGLYNNMRLMVLQVLPAAMMEIGDSLVAIKRIQTFLVIDELQPTPALTLSSDSENMIEVRNLAAKWHADDKWPVISNINLTIPRRSMHIFVGTVGSGKSTLMHAFLNELIPIKGRMSINGVVSYASQEPWIFPGTVKENILFGEPYDLDKYSEVTRVCGLLHDLDMFEKGDQTMVGERGLKLSGGQKARINLARAVYRPADIYILDDPLSAVDAHIGALIFSQCIQEYLKDKVVLLVTHQLQYLSKGNATIHVMDNGTVTSVASYDELKSKFPDIVALADDGDKKDEKKKKSKSSAKASPGKSGSDGKKGPKKFDVEESAMARKKKPEKIGKRSVFKTWFRFLRMSKNLPLVIFFIFLMCTYNLVLMSWDLVMLTWMNEHEFSTNATDTNPDEPPPTHSVDIHWLIILASVTLLQLFYLMSIAYTNVFVTRRAIRNIHKDMFRRVLYATMTFFDSSPTGKILNNFSRDLNMLDEQLLPVSLNFLSTLYLFGIVVIICYLDWVLLPAMLFYIFMFFSIIRIYMCSSKSLFYLEGVMREPIFGIMSSTIGGLATIRASKKTKKVKTEFYTAQNVHTTTFYSRIGGVCWLILYSEFFFGFVYFYIVYNFYIQRDYYFGRGGDVGTMLQWSSMLTNMMSSLFQKFNVLEVCLGAADRMFQYQKVETEFEAMKRTDDNTPEDWPPEGAINFREVSAKYPGDQKYVLKDIQLNIKAGEKLGIAGRTGAGKSTLLSVLFRLMNFEGKVVIDGMDSKKIAVDYLRQCISIIPQDPIIFQGTVRSNIDPFEEFTDEQIWDVLEKVNMKETVSNMSDGLYTQLDSGGTSISLGQRQILCLARIMLRKRRILVLDEATASVDLATDRQMQTILRTYFNDCTILTVAHRLKTIMDSDRILVMADGQILELDTPENLLANPESVFKQMVDASELQDDDDDE